VDLDQRLAAVEREPDARGRVVVEPLGEADVLEAEAEADATAHALAVGRVRHAAGQLAQVAAVAGGRCGRRQRIARNRRQLGRPFAGSGGRPGLSAGGSRPQRVADPQLDRVHVQCSGELVI
jgi:hypothetical protein